MERMALVTKRDLKVAALVLGICCSAHALAESLPLVSGNDYAPYADEKLPHGGMATEIVQKAFEAAGLKSHIDWLPWARNLAAVQSGRYAATYPYRKTAERKRDFYFSEPVFESEERIFARRGSKLNGADLSSVLKKRICLPPGWSAPDPIATLLAKEKIQVERPNDISTCIRMIAVGRADFFVTDGIQGRATLAQIRQQDVVQMPGVVARSAYHLLTARNNEHAVRWLNAFNQGLAQLKKSGAYRRIVLEHGGE